MAGELFVVSFIVNGFYGEFDYFLCLALLMPFYMILMS